MRLGAGHGHPESRLSSQADLPRVRPTMEQQRLSGSVNSVLLGYTVYWDSALTNKGGLLNIGREIILRRSTKLSFLATAHY
jgi:hypothetical protein